MLLSAPLALLLLHLVCLHLIFALPLTVFSFLPACGGAFHMAEGTLDSPGYPEVYPSNVECVWNIVSSPGNRLQLSFM